jgi:hypothetical protein
LVDDAVLRRILQKDLDALGISGDVADQLVSELNTLACLLIDAVTEGKSHGKTN